jgi:hypothetical protein
MTRIKRFGQNKEDRTQKLVTISFLPFTFSFLILHSPFSIPIATLARFYCALRYQSTRYSQLSTFGLTFQICEMYEICELYEMYEIYEIYEERVLRLDMRSLTERGKIDILSSFGYKKAVLRNLMALRFLLFLGLVLLITSSVSANEIDELKTASDVNQFLSKILGKDSEALLLDTKEDPKAEFGKNTFHKLDIDGNGQTDLMVESNYLFAVTDKKDVVMVDRGGFTFYRYTLLNIEKKDNETALHIRPRKVEDMPPPESDKELTLVFKHGGFVEYNPTPDHFKIDAITLTTSGCFGSCPVYSISIKADRRATYSAKRYNPEDGEFSGTIDATEFNALVEIINYIGLASLKTQYSVPWTDDQRATLSITYDGGKTKKISDYGMIGSYGLANLYNNISHLRTNQKWTKVK